jgi:CubicO group peptidase (beta-lactamase class C family)
LRCGDSTGCRDGRLLVEAGRVKLSAPLATYLPDYPNRDVATKVTIHQLLSDTGGTGDIFGPDFDAHRNRLRALADYVKLYGKRGPEFKPGSQWACSNYGFILLGRVIERSPGTAITTTSSNTFTRARG